MNLANRLSAVTQVAYVYFAWHTFTRTSIPLPPRTTVGSLVNPPLPRPCRWLPAVLVAFVLVGFAPLKAVAQAPQTQTVSLNSPLIPDVDGNGPDLGVGDSFRLLFLTKTDISGTSRLPVTYNNHVQNAANIGYASIRAFASQFRALVSVRSSTADDARENTATNSTGIPIYWLLGAQVANDYDDFYNGSWGSRAATNEDGGVVSNPSWVWTGSNADGTRATDTTPGNPDISRPLGNGQSQGWAFGHCEPGNRCTDKPATEFPKSPLRHVAGNQHHRARHQPQRPRAERQSPAVSADV